MMKHITLPFVLLLFSMILLSSGKAYSQITCPCWHDGIESEISGSLGLSCDISDDSISLNIDFGVIRGCLTTRVLQAGADSCEIVDSAVPQSIGDFCGVAIQPPFSDPDGECIKELREFCGEPEAITCSFESPGDKWLVKLPVLVVVGLTDPDGNVVGKQDLPESADGTISNPVAMVSCGAKADEKTLIFVPGPRRHPINLWTRLLYLGKNVPVGTCTVDVYSGDEDAYTLDPDSCHTEYEAVKIFGRH